MKIELSRIPFPQKDAKARTQFKIKPVLSSSRSGRKRQWIDKSTFVCFRFPIQAAERKSLESKSSEGQQEGR